MLPDFHSGPVVPVVPVVPQATRSYSVRGLDLKASGRHVRSRCESAGEFPSPPALASRIDYRFADNDSDKGKGNDSDCNYRFADNDNEKAIFATNCWQERGI